jgi:PTS system, glucose subfamily, IIA component
VQSAATHTVFAPVSGSLVDTADIADKVFASGAMGETIAIEPADGAIRSPIAGTVIAAPQSGYAFGIKGDNGLEVLVHVGIDTVQLAGTGFQPQVSVGDRVDVGQLLVDVSLPTIVEAGLQATTIVIVTNSTKVGEFERLVSAGDIVAGEPTLSLNIPAAA